MLNLRMLVKVNKKGFTLVEMIVTMTIAMILTSLAMVSYKSYQKKARQNEGKRTIAFFISSAEVFYANARFYIPNTEEMNIPMKGGHKYNYMLACHESTSSTYAFSDNTKVCGEFDHSSNTSKCWMGYVLSHVYQGEGSVTAQVGSCEPPGESIYPSRGGAPFGGALVFPDYSEYSTETSSQNNVKDYFRVEDYSTRCGDSSGGSGRVSIKDNPLSWAQECVTFKEWAMKASKIEPIVDDVVSSDSDVNKDDFISGPEKLVITGVACEKQKNSGCGSAGDKYHLLRLDSNKILFSKKGDTP